MPHFYLNFYVYQYATSIAGAAGFTDAILKEGAPAPYRALVARMNRLLDEFEALQVQSAAAGGEGRK